MTLCEPRYAERDEVFAQRTHRAAGQRFLGLWVAGSLAGLARPTVAVVGARAASEGGRARARELGRDLAAAGVCVLSGLALGIDGSAHAGALSAGGPTIGILGGGHRHFFPPRNRALADAILAADGAVLSPFPPDEPARPPQFLQRNAVVAALADAVVVVEAAARSGALNTAGWAGELGIDVLAFPGDVDRPKAAGCNALIRDGATLVRDAGDVLAALGLASHRQAAPGLASGGQAAQPSLWSGSGDRLTIALEAALSDGPCAIDDLAERTGEPAGRILAALVALELAGSVERRDAATYALVRRRG